MLIGILPTAAFAADEDGISPASTGGGSWTDGSVISSPVTLDGTVPTVEVTGTVTVNATITVTGNVRITGGGTLLRDSSNTSNDMIVVSSGGTLTLDDITIDGNNVQATARGIRVASGGKLTINEGTIITHNTWKDETGCKGAALYVAGNAVMNGGRIEYNNSRNYGNVYISNSSTNPATFTMNGGIVSHNSLFHSDSDYGGGAFYVRDGVLEINGGTISDHTGITAPGGAIYCSSFGKVYLNGGAIENNTVANNKKGDAIFYSSQEDNGAELYIGGNPLIENSIYLDNAIAVKYPYITSQIKNPLTLVVDSYTEGRVIAEGSNYTLTEADLAKVTLKVQGSSTPYYAKLDGNQLLMTNTDPGYTKKYNISYLGNGGTGSTLDDNAYDLNASATIKANSFSREGHAFTGWNTKDDGTGKSYKAGDEITITDDLILYAQWMKNAYTVTFDVQGKGNNFTDAVLYNTAVTEPAAPTATDYTFDGWYKDADCSDDQKWDFASDVVTKNTTLYAKWTVTVQAHKHPVGGTEIDFLPWTQTTSLPNSGDYYLTKNVTLDDSWKPTGTVTLCLNGKTITENGYKDAIYVDSGKIVTLCDCKNSGTVTHASGATGRGVQVKGTFNMYGGNITGNNINSAGGGVQVNGTFNMHGGSITNNTATANGGGVDLHDGCTFIMTAGTISGNTSKALGGGVNTSNGSKFTMSGGTITDNTAVTNGGGVHLYSNMTVSGKINISGNVVSDSTRKNNVDCDAYQIILNGLKSGTKIGVTKTIYGSNPVAFTTDTAKSGDEQYFTSDASHYVVYKNDKLFLSTNSHEHTWKYEAAGGVITATCTHTGCTESGGTVTLTAPKPADLTYNGQPKAATATNDLTTGASVSAQDIVYKQGETVLGGAPTDVGTYTASITLIGADSKSATAQVQYEIKPAELTLPNASVVSKPYDGEVTATIQPGSLSGIFNTDDVRVAQANISGTFDDANVGTNKTVTTTEKFTLTGDKANNYKLIQPTGLKGSITAVAASLTGKPQAKTDLEYNGNAQELVTADGVAVTGGKLVYSTTETGTYSETIPKETNAGTYDIWYKVQGDSNHSDTTPVKLTIAIRQKPVTVSGITAKDKVYDGTNSAVLNAQIAVFDGKVDSDELTVTASGAFVDKNAGNNKTVNITNLTLGGTGKGNYTLDTEHSQKTALAAITARPLTIAAASATNRVYQKDNKAVAVDVKFTNAVDTLVKGADYTVTGTMENDIAGNSAKNVTVKVVLINSNYSLDNPTTSTTVTISKLAAPTITAAPIKHKRGDTAEKEVTPQWIGLPNDMGNHNFSATVKSTPTGVSLGSWSMDVTTGKINYTLTGAANVGDSIVLEVLLTSENYADAKFELKINIEDKDPQSNFKFENRTQTKTYGDAKFTIAAVGAVEGSTVTYVSNHPEIASVNAATGEVTIKGAGAAVITATAAETANHAEAQASYTLTVAKKAITVTPNALSKIVGANDPVLTYTVSGAQNNEVPGFTGALSRAQGETAGTYAIKLGTLALADKGTFKASNYTLQFSSTPVLFTINTRHSGGSSGGGSSNPKYTVTVPSSTTGGSVKSSVSSASGGSTVTITVTPADGYKVDKVSVVDSKGNPIKVTDKGGNKYTFTMPSSKITVTPVFSKIEETKPETSPFDDVTANDYFYDAVKWAADKDITGGVSSSLFAPADGCTRAQIVTFLWRTAGSPEPKALNSFDDVPADAYYAKAVAWAVENGITVGTTATTFSPDAICTRAHGVAFLYRAAKAAAPSGELVFTDVSANAYYADAVKWATEKGITKGISDTLFGPNNTCTRAQIVTFLYRLYGSK